MGQAPLVAAVPHLRRVLRGRDRGDLQVRPGPRAARARGAVPGRGAARARREDGEVLHRRLALPRARLAAHGAQEPALARRVPGAHRLRRPPRPRPVEHPRDDRRRRDAPRDGPLLARAPANRGAAARERGAGAVRVLVHRHRPGGLLRLADRQRARDGPADRARLDVPGREGAHGPVVQGADRHGRGRDGPRLLVLRDERARDDLPVAARPRREAAVAPLEVLRDGRRRAHGRDGPGRDPGAAGQRRLALQGGPRG